MVSAGKDPISADGVVVPPAAAATTLVTIHVPLATAVQCTQSSNHEIQCQDPLETTASQPSPAIIGQQCYGTRLTNDPHLANSASLGKHTMDEIVAIADQKRAERQVLLKKKKKTLNVQKVLWTTRYEHSPCLSRNLMV